MLNFVKFQVFWIESGFCVYDRLKISCYFFYKSAIFWGFD